MITINFDLLAAFKRVALGHFISQPTKMNIDITPNSNSKKRNKVYRKNGK